MRATMPPVSPDAPLYSLLRLLHLNEAGRVELVVLVEALEDRDRVLHHLAGRGVIVDAHGVIRCFLVPDLSRLLLGVFVLLDLDVDRVNLLLGGCAAFARCAPSRTSPSQPCRTPPPSSAPRGSRRSL